MSRGFVTIATGKDNYYRIAANLLRSYRYYSKDPVPFAIICDRKNRYTELFDKVMIMEDPCFSYVDKIRLPEFMPYDETIFIDSDCLAYKDLNDFWDIFENADDFSAFGANYPLKYKFGWFKKEDVGIYSEQVKYIPDFIGGVYYLRKTDKLKEFYEIVNHVKATYHDYRFRQFEDVCDEPVNALAMAVCGFRTMGEKSPDICFYPHIVQFESDISEGKVRYESKYLKDRGLIPEAYMIHWGSGNTTKPVYLLEVYRLDRICEGKPVTQAGVKIAELRIRSGIFLKQTYQRIKRKIRSAVRRDPVAGRR